ncbi:MAG: Cobalamin import ATP-binding protein BtuD [Candidatus Heimdallarchaeota archaeon LC_2]|nr:MAG: Cobalamin import ATP-binding protein BtuD [Candidatus Heimdallarchaeota archaeon LC_2]
MISNGSSYCTEMRVIDVNNLSFNYTNNSILSNISFEVYKGDFIGVIGENGTGKTTLLNCINGSLKINSGSISVLDKDINGYSKSELAKLMATVSVGVNSSINPQVCDFLMLGRYPFTEKIWWETDEDEKIVKKIVNQFKLHPFLDRKLRDLSNGELQQVLIAKGMIQTPRILLVDEPSSNLDLKHKIQMMNYFSFLSHGKKLTIIIASHDLNLVNRYCNKVILLKNQAIYKIGKPTEVLTKKNLEVVFQVKVEIIKSEVGDLIMPYMDKIEKRRNTIE